MRTRDIIHRDGPRLRLRLSAGESGYDPLLRLGDPGRANPATIILDLYAAELLAGFLMSARVTAVGELPEEVCLGDYPLSMRLGAHGGDIRIELVQGDERLLITRPLWDRLYTELQLVLAHARHFARAAIASGFALFDQRRRLH